MIKLKGVLILDGKAKKVLYSVYKWLTACVVTAFSVTLAVLCIKIYTTGEGVFSREIVASTFSLVAPLFYVTAVIVIAGFVLGIFKSDNNKKRTAVSPSSLLAIYKKRYTVNVDEARKEEKKRVILKSVCGVVCCIIAIFPIFYLANANNFSVEDINADIISASFAVFIPCAVIFALSLFCTLICKKSIARENEIYKSEIAKGNAEKKTLTQVNNKNVLYIRCILITAAAVLIVLGIFNDGIGDVYGKAIRICTECIGLG